MSGDLAHQWREGCRIGASQAWVTRSSWTDSWTGTPPLDKTRAGSTAAAGNTRLGPELAELNTLAAAHGERVFLDALSRAVAFGRWRAADVRSILAAGAGTPQPTTAGDALVLELPVGPTRPLSDYAIRTSTIGATTSASTSASTTGVASTGGGR